MPWTWLARAIFGLIFYGVISRRRRGVPVVDAQRLRHTVDTGRVAAVAVAHAVTALTLTVAGAVAATACTTLLVFGPRWLGAVLALVVMLFLTAAVQEGLVCRAEFSAHRRRRLAHDLTVHVMESDGSEAEPGHSADSPGPS